MAEKHGLFNKFFKDCSDITTKHTSNITYLSFFLQQKNHLYWQFLVISLPTSE